MHSTAPVPPIVRRSTRTTAALPSLPLPSLPLVASTTDLDVDMTPPPVPAPVPAFAHASSEDPQPAEDPVLASVSASVPSFAANATTVKELDIVLSFDTTGSMSSILYQVRKDLARLVDAVFTQSAARGISVRLAVMAQGDYGGRIGLGDSAPTCGSDYTVIGTPFSASAAVSVAFIQTVRESAHQASEAGEAYEQVLKLARGMAWRATAQKVLILIGDDEPHTPTCRENTAHVDWRTEAAALVAAGVRLFAVHCLTCWTHTEPFYRALGVSGAYLPLVQFNAIVELLLATFYCATGETPLLARLEDDIITRGRYSRGLELAFNGLMQRPDAGRAVYSGNGGSTGAGVGSGGGSGGSGGGAGRSGRGAGTGGMGRVAIAPGRFQRLDVDADTSIKAFVEATGVRYKAGGGYYELSKAEDVTAAKGIVLEHIASGEMFTGQEARNMLGLGGGETKVKPKSVPPGHRAFIQSTSFTRKLIGGTSFLYENDTT